MFQSLKLHITKTPKVKVPNKELIFGKTFTDHMLVLPFDSKWGTPEIKPYAPLVLDPSSTVFHYGISCFEGMKAYKSKEGKVLLFRPQMNITRFQKSCARIALPSFSEEEFTKMLTKFVQVEQSWIPNEMGYSLYLR